MDESVDMGGDSAMPDSGLMDPMDDLFGESTDGMGVSLPSMPLPAPVVLRNAEIQRSGCYSRIVWSYTGSVAQISLDGSEITFRAMIRNQKSSKWSLSNTLRESIKCPKGRRFVHLAFNGIGIEMAAIDQLGGIHLFTVVGPLNRMQQSPGHTNPTDVSGSDLDNVVGVHWLSLYPTEFRSPYITPATKINGKWITQSKPRDPNSPRVHHPIDNRNALLHVTSNGKLSLLYQNESGMYQTASTQLDVFGSSGDLLSHAAFGEDGANLLLATHDEARRLYLFKISINWNTTQQTRGNMHYLTVSPTLEIGHLTALEKALPQISEEARLSHLHIIPVPPDMTDQHGALTPVVFGVYTHAASSLDDLQAQSETVSVLVRWHVESIIPTLHESFKKLKPNGITPVTASTTVLRRQPDLVTNKLILSVQSQNFHTILALVSSDGTIDFRDRSTFGSIDSYGDTTSVSSLPQTGFEQTQGEHYPHVAISADGSTLICSRADGTTEAKLMKFRYGWQPVEDGMTDSKGLIETAVVCLARQYSVLSYSTYANDDPISLLPLDLSPELRSFFCKEIIRMTGGRPDLSMLEIAKQQMAMFKDPFVFRAISAQLILGVKQNSPERTFSGQIAYVMLNLRFIGMALAQTVGQKSDHARVTVPISLLAPVQWATDLMVFLVDSITNVERKKPAGQSLKQAFEKIIAEEGNPALHLLLCSVSRAQLRSLILYVPAYFRLCQQSMQNATSIYERQQLETGLERARSLPFQMKSFQDLITELDGTVRQTYSNPSISAERRLEIELAMLTEGAIPTEMESVLESLVSKHLSSLLNNEGTDGTKLYFWNTIWLDIARLNTSAASKQIDTIRKTPIKAGTNKRICRRCGSQTEDMSQEAVRQGPSWLYTAQRHCICLNTWWLV